MNARRLTLVWLCVVVGVLVGCVPASAATGHAFASSFGTFTTAAGVAVDDSAGAAKGEVYVVDQGADQVDRFTASEAAKGEVGTQLTGATLVAPDGVAVDDSGGVSAGDVYVSEPTEGAVDKFNGVTGKYESQITARGVPHAVSFEPVGVGVDPANGDVFVADAHNDVVDVFTAAGAYDFQFGANVLVSPTGSALVLAGIAVNSAGDAYLTTTGGEAFEFIAAGEYTSVLPVGVGVSALSIDPANSDVYLDEGFVVQELGVNGESLGSFGAGSLGGSSGVGVDSASGTVYASNIADAVIFTAGETPKEPVTTTAPTGVTGSTATFKGALSGGETGYYFAYNAGGSCTGGASSEPGTASGGTAVSTTVGGLAPATQYTVCLVATNTFGSTTSAGVGFQTESVVPMVEGESFSEVGSHSALVNAQVNMENVEGSYFYAYGTSAAFQAGDPSRTTEVDLPASGSPVAAPAQLTGLQPDSEYHFRIVTRNIDKEVNEGALETFRTLAAGTTGLPDGRVYEMVTPPNNDDAEVYVPQAFPNDYGDGIQTRRPFQVSPDGDAVTYLSDVTTGGNGSGGTGTGNQNLARRSAGGGWVQTVIEPPSGKQTYYEGFSSNLMFGALTSGNPGEPEVPPLSPQASSNGSKVLYVRDNGESLPGSDPYQPLFGTPLNRSPKLFGTNRGVVASGTNEAVAVFGGATPGFDDVLFEANDALIDGSGRLEQELEQDAKQEIQNDENHNYLYDSVDGQLSLVDVLPGGEGKVAPDAIFGALPLELPEENAPDFGGVISGDGEHVFWTDLVSGVVYVRIDGMSTVQVSAGAARYWASAAESRYAFYTENSDLYRFDVTDGAREVLAGSTSPVLGVIGVSEDGESVYYVAETETHPTLYLRDRDGTIRIAALSSEDGEQVDPYGRTVWAPELKVGDWQAGLAQRTARVTSDGDAVVFVSDQSLPVVGYPRGYPNGGLDEVYLYDAIANQLHCVSCSPSGEEPTLSVRGAAGYLPISWSDTYMPQWVSEDGHRVFFDSAVGLVPQDTNGKQDVYEWEQEGDGSCTTGSGTDGGCIYLLSGGTSGSDSWFIGASASGDDVFIATRAQLSTEDLNENFDLYDAHVGGVKPVSAPACTGTGCQGVPAPPPPFATPPSVTFNGVGNYPPPAPEVTGKVTHKKLTRAQKLAAALKVCRKQKRRSKRAACEARARKQGGVRHKAKKVLRATKKGRR
jgi:hypothetical protein